MTTTHTPMNDRNVCWFTMSKSEAACLIRDLASAIADKGDEIQMEFRTERRNDYSKADGEKFHAIRIGLQNSFGMSDGRITESATWE